MWEESLSLKETELVMSVIFVSEFSLLVHISRSEKTKDGLLSHFYFMPLVCKNMKSNTIWTDIFKILSSIYHFQPLQMLTIIFLPLMRTLEIRYYSEKFCFIYIYICFIVPI